MKYYKVPYVICPICEDFYRYIKKNSSNGIGSRETATVINTKKDKTMATKKPVKKAPARKVVAKKAAPKKAAPAVKKAVKKTAKKK